MKTLVFLCCIVLVAAACSVQDAAPPLAPDHPASPHAESGLEPEPTDTLVPSARPGLDAPTASGGDRMSGQADTFTCPMHPEIRAARPGRCPKCGMDLIPLDRAAPSLEKHHAH